MVSDDEHFETGTQRTEKLVWAKCREPFKTRIDNLTSQWVQGSVSDERVALEILTMRDLVEFVEQPHPGTFRNSMNDVTSQLQILTDTMLSIRKREHDTWSELRRHVLKCAIEQSGGNSLKGRG